jgi:hypothetical protein
LCFQERDIEMRDIERLLVWFNVAGSLLAGYHREPLWFLLPAAGFGAYLMVQDRALRRRIGERAWPSEGFARFNFNTNLNFGLSHLLLGALLFAIAGTIQSVPGI